MYRLFNPLKGQSVTNLPNDEPWTGRAIENYRARRRAAARRGKKMLIIGILGVLVMCLVVCGGVVVLAPGLLRSMPLLPVRF